MLSEADKELMKNHVSEDDLDLIDVEWKQKQETGSSTDNVFGEEPGDITYSSQGNIKCHFIPIEHYNTISNEDQQDFIKELSFGDLKRGDAVGLFHIDNGISVDDKIVHKNVTYQITNIVSDDLSLQQVVYMKRENG